MEDCYVENLHLCLDQKYLNKSSQRVDNNIKINHF